MQLGRSRSAKAIATCVVMATAIVCGCADKKKSKKAPTKAPTPPAVQGLAAVPANASAVIGIDVAALAGSPIVGRALERMFARDPGLQDALTKVLDDCQLDLKTDVVSATIALVPTKAELRDSLLVAKGAFKEGKIVACLGKSLGEAGGRVETSTFEGRSLYHQVGDPGPGLWFSFGSSDTILVSSGRDALEASLGTGPKLDSAKTGVAGHLARAKTDANLWAIGEIDPAVGEGLIAATGGKVQAPSIVVASADLSTGLAISADLEMRNEDDAKVLISQARAQLMAAALVLQIDSLGRMVQKAELAADGHWATLRWSLTPEELEDLMGANLSGLGSSIDNEGANDENPAPKSETESEEEHGN